MNARYLWSASFSVLCGFAWGLSSPERLVTLAVTTDDPMQIDDQIASIKTLSLQDTYPDLVAIGSTPLDGSLTGRLLITDSTIIPSLTSTVFTADGLSSHIHADTVSVS